MEYSHPQVCNGFGCHSDMWRSGVRWAGLTPLTERIVIDCQSLSRQVGPFTDAKWTKVEGQIFKNLSSFSGRQLVLTMSALARSDFRSRRLMLALSQQVMGEVQSTLTLRDYSVIVNALAKLGLRNEIFLVSAIPAILRKVRVSPAASVGSIALVLDGYTKLGFLGDGKLMTGCLEAIAARMDSVKPVDATTVLRAISRLSPLEQATVPPAIVVALMNLVEGEFVIPCLTAVAKLSVRSDTILDETSKLVRDVLGDGLDDVAAGRLIHAFNAISVLGTKDDQQRVFSHVISRLRAGKLWSECSNEVSAIVLCLSGMTRCAEALLLAETDELIQSILPRVSELGHVGVSVLVNLFSVINSPLPLSVRDYLEHVDFSEFGGQAFVVLLNAFSKLDEIEFLVRLVADVPPSREVLKDITDQGAHMALLALVQFLDRFAGLPVGGGEVVQSLVQWIDALAGVGTGVGCVQSDSQLRIVSAIVSSSRFLGSVLAPSTQRILRQAKVNKLEGEPVISRFHQSVIEAVLGIGEIVEVNALDAYTGYEMDLCIAPRNLF